MSAYLAAISIYPIKSCAGIALDAAQVQARGLADDRRFMLVDGSGRFLTGRELPQLVRIQAQPLAPNCLRLHAPSMDAIEVEVGPDAQRRTAEVWGDIVDAADAGDRAAEWFSRYLGRSVRLVYADAAMHRPVEDDYSQPGDEFAFADGFPVLLLSRAASDELSTRAGRELGWRRFRPNLLADGVAAHAEDHWQRIRIGRVEFDVVKACVRCVFTRVDPDSGIVERDGEPLTSLKDYRRGPKGIRFGQNLIARGIGTVRVGDAIEVLE